jgi:hypothetical protein
MLVSPESDVVPAASKSKTFWMSALRTTGTVGRAVATEAHKRAASTVCMRNQGRGWWGDRVEEKSISGFYCCQRCALSRHSQADETAPRLHRARLQSQTQARAHANPSEEKESVWLRS